MVTKGGGKFAALATYKEEITPPVTGRQKGKRSDPAYETSHLLLKSATKRKAWRLLEDIGSDMDLSDLVEKLLDDWVSAHDRSSS